MEPHSHHLGDSTHHPETYPKPSTIALPEAKVGYSWYSNTNTMGQDLPIVHLPVCRWAPDQGQLAKPETELS